MPRYSQIVDPTKMFTEIEIVNILPSFAFIDDVNITTYVEASPVYNISSLVCKWQDVETPGVYVVTDEGERI
jgi:hypothetical protein